MTPPAGPVLRLTRQQVREVDRIAIERYGIPGIVLMENASRGAADVAWAMLSTPLGALSANDHAGSAAQRSPRVCPASADVLILCGGGNNGGDGLAIARHLHNRGWPVRIAFTIDPAMYRGDAAINWNVVRAMGLPHAAFSPTQIGQPELIIDAVFGTGLTRPPRAPFGELAEAVNSSGIPVLSIDLPSGLDCDTGRPLGPTCVRATRTATFVAEKAGFAAPSAADVLGQVTVVDIGCPRELIEELTRLPNG